MTGPVKIQSGWIEGVQEDGYRVYRGIPFAAPPVGHLRWRSPEPETPWQDVLKAETFAPSPMQNRMPNPAFRQPELELSEDCLYLNIWTPATSAEDKFPVMVWIYGGGFSGGSTAIPLYSGEQLAKKGVVVASIAYRVGPFGFMAHPELSAESSHGISGNYGLLDQIAALDWIQRNIEAFGGDPTRVTVFGESAGGISISILAASLLAKGLFQSAISESGGSFGPTRTPSFPGENLYRLADAEECGIQFAESMGVKNIQDLRNIPAEKLLKQATGWQGLSWPVLDGWVIPDDQHRLYEAGQYNDTPILIGINSDEGAIFNPASTLDGYISSVRNRYGPYAKKLLKFYAADSDATAKRSARDLIRDAAFGWHNWVWARLQSRTGKSKVFYFYFDQVPPRGENSPFKDARAVHASEMMYVFKHLDQINLKWTLADREIEEAMATYWTNFAKYGDPNGEGVPQWPAFSETNPMVMHFNETPHVGTVPNPKQLEGLDEYFAWRRTPDGAELGRAR